MICSRRPIDAEMRMVLKAVVFGQWNGLARQEALLRDACGLAWPSVEMPRRLLRFNKLLLNVMNKNTFCFFLPSLVTAALASERTCTVMCCAVPTLVAVNMGCQSRLIVDVFSMPPSHRLN